MLWLLAMTISHAGFNINALDKTRVEIWGAGIGGLQTFKRVLNFQQAMAL